MVSPIARQQRRADRDSRGPEIADFDSRCVGIEHVFRSGRTKQVHKVDARRCKGDDGVWRLQ